MEQCEGSCLCDGGCCGGKKHMNKSLTVINLFAGPGAGKSTTAAGIFNKAKKNRWKIELVTEYAKDRVYDGFLGCLEDQIYIFGQQQRRVKRLVGSVEYAVTDSPIFLSTLYNKDLSLSFEKLVYETFNSYNNINFFINRKKPYEQYGRIQDEAGARELDEKLLCMLDEWEIPYYLVDGDEVCEDRILEMVEEHVKSYSKSR